MLQLDNQTATVAAQLRLMACARVTKAARKEEQDVIWWIGLDFTAVRGPALVLRESFVGSVHEQACQVAVAILDPWHMQTSASCCWRRRSGWQPALVCTDC